MTIGSKLKGVQVLRPLLISAAMFLPNELEGSWADTEPSCHVSGIYTGGSGNIDLLDASGNIAASKPEHTIAFPLPVLAVDGFLVGVPIAKDDKGLQTEEIGWLNLVDIEETIPANCLDVLPENYSFVCAIGTMGTRGASACQSTD